MIVWIPTVLATMIGMEGWAAVLHGRVWHSVLWWMHRSHHRGRGDIAHQRQTRQSAWELNNLLSCVHAPVAVALILYGCMAAPSAGRDIAYGVGLGMTGYGILYVLVHDGLVHGRLPLRFLLRFSYMRAIRAAHGLHHRTGGPPFGMFFGPWHPAFLARRRKRRALET